MKCTSCHQGLLTPVQLDDLFPAHACTHCGGNWIYLHNYLRWLDRDGGIDTADSDYRVEAQETAHAMLCPKTGRLMLKYRISKNTPHKYVFLVLSHERRKVVHSLGIQEVLTAPRSPWQNPCVEQLIGSIRRECIDPIFAAC